MTWQIASNPFQLTCQTLASSASRSPRKPSCVSTHTLYMFAVPHLRKRGVDPHDHREHRYIPLQCQHPYPYIFVFLVSHKSTLPTDTLTVPVATFPVTRCADPHDCSDIWLCLSASTTRRCNTALLQLIVLGGHTGHNTVIEITPQNHSVCGPPIIETVPRTEVLKLVKFKTIYTQVKRHDP
jgi:hypothetical protein